MRRAAVAIVALLLAVPAWGQSGSRSFVYTEDDYIALSSNPLPSDDATYTIGLWYRGTSWPTFEYMFNLGNSSAGQVEIVGLYITNAPIIGFYIRTDTGAGSKSCSATHSTAPSLNTWQWVSGFRDDGDCTIRFDGSSEAGVEQVAHAATVNLDTFTIGRRMYDGSWSAPFDGTIAYVQIWDRVLSDEEMDQAMNCPGSVPDGLVGYWPLIDGGSTLYDQSDSGIDGTNNGTAVSTLGPPISHCSGGN